MVKTRYDIGEHFLFPSGLFVDKKPHEVQTVLGSGIAVCLFDTKFQFGGINHYMLPVWNGEGIPSPKYGDVAIELLLERMISLGASKHHLIAKVFGGAAQYTQNRTSILDIGDRNTQAAVQLLKKNGVNIMAQNVGGNVGRKIIFHTHTGQVFMRLFEK